MQKKTKALVVGAGIAGCSVAITLASRGLAVTLVEKAAEWRFASSGIFVYGNGLKALEGVGVLPGILDAGFAIADGRNIYLGADGAPLVDTFYPHPPGRPDIPPILGIKRGEMHRVLAARLSELGVDIRLATTVTALAPGNAAEPAQVTLSDGAQHRFDLVVGADGIRSQVRTLLLGEQKPRYTGVGVWRSVHTRPPELTAKYMFMGPGKRLGIMPISDDRLYLFGTVSEPADAWYPREQWPALMRERFAEFHGPARPFLDELSDASEVLYTAVEEVVLPLPWHCGRVLLIGDAAHASTPFMGQGGAMAVEDAVVLAELMATLGSDADDDGAALVDVLAAFGERRYPMCKLVQDVSRAVGEAGAREEGASFGERLQTFKAGAQRQVDDFYGRMHQLSAPVAQPLLASGACKPPRLPIR